MKVKNIIKFIYVFILSFIMCSCQIINTESSDNEEIKSYEFVMTYDYGMCGK